jgi:hypothetical protein
LRRRDAGDQQLGLEPDDASPSHWLSRLEQTFGTDETAFAEHLLNQLVEAIHIIDKDPAVTERTVNAALAAVHGIGPRDEAEAMLVAQMVATHGLAMSLTKVASTSTFPPQIEAALNNAIKLMRTYTAQMEALVRYRRRGEQTVRVEHVHVHPGGQAVVGIQCPDGRSRKGFTACGSTPRACRCIRVCVAEPALGAAGHASRRR